MAASPRLSSAWPAGRSSARGSARPTTPALARVEAELRQRFDASAADARRRRAARVAAERDADSRRAARSRPAAARCSTRSTPRCRPTTPARTGITVYDAAGDAARVGGPRLRPAAGTRSTGPRRCSSRSARSAAPGPRRAGRRSRSPARRARDHRRRAGRSEPSSGSPALGRHASCCRRRSRRSRCARAPAHAGDAVARQRSPFTSPDGGSLVEAEVAPADLAAARARWRARHAAPRCSACSRSRCCSAPAPLRRAAPAARDTPRGSSRRPPARRAAARRRARRPVRRAACRSRRRRSPAPLDLLLDRAAARRARLAGGRPHRAPARRAAARRGCSPTDAGALVAAVAVYAAAACSTACCCGRYERLLQQRRRRHRRSTCCTSRCIRSMPSRLGARVRRSCCSTRPSIWSGGRDHPRCRRCSGACRARRLLAAVAVGGWVAGALAVVADRGARDPPIPLGPLLRRARRRRRLRGVAVAAARPRAPGVAGGAARRLVPRAARARRSRCTRRSTRSRSRPRSG